MGNPNQLNLSERPLLPDDQQNIIDNLQIPSDWRAPDVIDFKLCYGKNCSSEELLQIISDQLDKARLNQEEFFGQLALGKKCDADLESYMSWLTVGWKHLPDVAEYSLRSHLNFIIDAFKLDDYAYHGKRSKETQSYLNSRKLQHCVSSAIRGAPDAKLAREVLDSSLGRSLDDDLRLSVIENAIVKDGYELKQDDVTLVQNLLDQELKRVLGKTGGNAAGYIATLTELVPEEVGYLNNTYPNFHNLVLQTAFRRLVATDYSPSQENALKKVEQQLSTDLKSSVLVASWDFLHRPERLDDSVVHCIGLLRQESTSSIKREDLDSLWAITPNHLLRSLIENGYDLTQYHDYSKRIAVRRLAQIGLTDQAYQLARTPSKRADVVWQSIEIPLNLIVLYEETGNEKALKKAESFIRKNQKEIEFECRGRLIGDSEWQFVMSRKLMLALQKLCAGRVQNNDSLMSNAKANLEEFHNSSAFDVRCFFLSRTAQDLLDMDLIDQAEEYTLRLFNDESAREDLETWPSNVYRTVLNTVKGHWQNGDYDKAYELVGECYLKGKDPSNYHFMNTIRDLFEDLKPYKTAYFWSTNSHQSYVRHLEIRQGA